MEKEEEEVYDVTCIHLGHYYKTQYNYLLYNDEWLLSFPSDLVAMAIQKLKQPNCLS